MIEAKTLIAVRHVLLKDLYTVVQYIEKNGNLLACWRRAGLEGAVPILKQCEKKVLRSRHQLLQARSRLVPANRGSF